MEDDRMMALSKEERIPDRMMKLSKEERIEPTKNRYPARDKSYGMYRVVVPYEATPVCSPKDKKMWESSVVRQPHLNRMPSCRYGNFTEFTFRQMELPSWISQEQNLNYVI
ncbi:Hypothetical predicted protein [Octopus vulgaris]|uniref:Uncharacterized protein n=1 Tax=Octopus vulgaris TaxID=6645 RepID=A0AA36BY04_OCTVU|nr:Hypothetical predicted protein [Octopus vulgaris]